MFREPSAEERETGLAGVGGDAILLSDQSYSEFIQTRLAYWPIVETDFASVEPPVDPDTMEYFGADGTTVLTTIPAFTEAVTEVGLAEWQYVVRRVVLSRHAELWRMTNRLRAVAAEALAGVPMTRV